MADRFSPEQRSRLMASIRSTNTKIEVCLRSALHRRGLRFRKNVRSLPGCPDIVFVAARLAVFIDGDFWHGHRFEAWEAGLSPYWRDKIAGNRARDARNRQKLRRQGWSVMRVWGHDVEKNLDATAIRIADKVANRLRC